MATSSAKPRTRPAKAANGTSPAKPPRAGTITPPEPELTPRELIDRAVALRPLLREQAPKGEEMRRLPDETNAVFIAAGFYRTLQPRRFGGYEFDLQTFGKAMIEIARGDPAAAWVLAFTTGHTHVLAKYAERAQVEVYGDDGDFRGPFVGAGVQGSSAKPVKGGYILNGVWDYASGCHGATHFFGTAQVRENPDDPPKEMITALFDRKDFEIVENWEMLGMRGSGSHRVITNGLFVPQHRTNTRALGASDERQQPGHGVHKNPFYAGPSINVLMTEIAAVGIGTGYCALDAYEEIMRKRTAGLGPNRTSRMENADYQRYYGQAQAYLDTARDALIGCTTDYMDACKLDVEEDIRFSADMSQRIMLVQQQCTRLAGEAADVLVRSAGSSAMKPGTLMERTWRDMTTLRTHITLQNESSFAPAARVHFGLAPFPGDPRRVEGFGAPTTSK
ncbi:MAG TPA: oxidoreductase [Dehalococcoidia bacterium]|nr:oxidoreductase [Dehalococcoidia bacterium]